MISTHLTEQVKWDQFVTPMVSNGVLMDRCMISNFKSR